MIQWSILLLASLVLGFGLQRFHIPAALLLGPMIVGVAMGLLGATVRIPGYLFIAAQAVLGCMIAQSLSPAILTPLLDDWPLVLLVLIATLLASGVSGWCLVRYSSLPGPTGAWGSSPGGASAMVAMAGDFGADVRLVAFMQYLRVLFVATAAAMVARIGLGDEAGAWRRDAGVVPFTGLAFPGDAGHCRGRRLAWPPVAYSLRRVVAADDHRRDAAFQRYDGVTGAGMAAGPGLYPDWLERRAALHPADFFVGAAYLAADGGVDRRADAVLRSAGMDADAFPAGGFDDRLSGDQPGWVGYRGDHRRRQSGRHVFRDGDADAAFVHHLADWPGDGTIHF